MSYYIPLLFSFFMSDTMTQALFSTARISVLAPRKGKYSLFSTFSFLFGSSLSLVPVHLQAATGPLRTRWRSDAASFSLSFQAINSLLGGGRARSGADSRRPLARGHLPPLALLFFRSFVLFVLSFSVCMHRFSLIYFFFFFALITLGIVYRACYCPAE